MRTGKRWICCLAALLLAVSSLTVTAAEPENTAETPPYEGAVEFEGHYYKIFDATESWSDARSACKKMGGYLACITSEREQQFIESLNYWNDRLWIGGFREGYYNWQWVSGEEWSYTNWAAGEPNNSGNVVPDENCIALWPQQWNDLNNYNLYEQSGFICEWEKGTQNGVVVGSFMFTSQDSKVETRYPFIFSESWFERSSEEYIHPLAQMSIRMAMAAAVQEPDHIMDLFDQLGLSYTKESIHYPKPDFDYKEKSATIGYAIGHKTILSGDGEGKTLIAVAVRGGGYGAEWGDNFYIGAGSEHDGFTRAADQVVPAVLNYIDQLVSEGVRKENIKIWMTGFSRAAAVTNISAHRLTGRARNGKLEGMSPENIYAYCFECPRTMIPEYQETIIEKNIKNIINDADIVTKVAPQAWGFCRYGVDYHLPSSVSDKGYEELVTAQLYEYKKILEASGDIHNNEMDFDTFQRWTYDTHWLIGLSDKVVKTMAGVFQNQSTYSFGFEETVTKLIAKLLGDEKKKDLDNFWDAFISGLGILSTVRHPALAVLKLQLARIGKTLFYPHYPELCLAWMDALPGGYIYRDPKSRILRVNCPVNVTVRDEDGQIVAQITEDQEAELESVYEYFLDENGQKTFLLPLNGRYDVQIEAYDEGTMSVLLEDIDMQTDTVLRSIGYLGLSIGQGDSYRFVLEAGDPDEELPDCYLIDAGGNRIETSYTEKEALICTLSLECPETVYAAGEGEYSCGELVTLMIPEENAEDFLGWYQGNELLSTEPEYRFQITEDLVVTAKFKEIPAETEEAGSEKETVAETSAGNRESKADRPSDDDRPTESQSNWLPILIAVCAVAAGVVTAVLLVSKKKDKKR